MVMSMVVADIAIPYKKNPVLVVILSSHSVVQCGRISGAQSVIVTKYIVLNTK